MSGDQAEAHRPVIEEHLAALLEHSRELLVVLSGDGRLSWLGPAALRWLGPAAIDHPLVDLVSPADADAVTAGLAAATAGSGQVVDVCCRLRDAAGRWQQMDLTIAGRRSDPARAGLVCVARPAVEHGDVAARLIHDATHDNLTALPNRAGLLDRLDHPPPGSQPDDSGAVLYIDLDGFKEVNDSLGHGAGDRVLVTVADRLRRAVRPGDALARLGGDEFVVVADGVTDRTIALEIAERIVASLSRPVAVNGRLVTVSASVGVAIGRRDQAPSLLEQADRAMYRAKRDGRNRCALFDLDMGGADDHRAQVEELLRTALDRDGTAVVYQPIVELGSGRLTGMEAMLRIRAPDGRLLMPAAFLDVAERTGLAVAVGAGLLDLACGQAARWRARLGANAPPLMSVAVSARQLVDGHAPDRVSATLERHHLEASMLCLDLSGSTLVDADPTTTRSLEKLKDLGVRLAIEDFGSGRSSLGYLRRYDIDVLRIDRGFMTGLGHDEGDTEVVRAVVGLGEALGMTTVAKGVETAAQADVLRQLGCQQAQGFYFGRPALPEDRAGLRLDGPAPGPA